MNVPSAHLPQTPRKRDLLVAAACGAFVALMVGAAYASVPFYDWFCRTTGFAGTTQVAYAAPKQVLDRTVTVRFDANTTAGLPWRFTPDQISVTAKLGEVVTVGYTIVNDVSARDLQTRHGQWFKGKGLDTTCPIGPWIVTKDEFGDPSGHRITLRVNGVTRQDSNTADMLFDCAAIVASLSEGLTIEPGDIIATGTPSGVALGMSPQQWLKDSDVIEAEIAGIGVLRNRVRAC